MDLLFASGMIILVVLSAIVLIVFLNSNDRKQKVQCEMMLMKVFEFQIKKPELNLIYDSVKKNASDELIKRYESKKEPFILYLLSIFDFVIDYYFCRNLYSIKDPVMKMAWINTIRNFYLDSTDGREIYLVHQQEFNKRFQKFSDKMIKQNFEKERVL